MTIVFFDIVGFTKHTAEMKPEKIFEFVNHYLKYMLPVVSKYDGVVDKIMGDGVLAVFPKNPKSAILAAVEMQYALRVMNQESARIAFPQVSMGVGVHRSKTALGTVGVKEHMENTVLSEGVNLGSRIERLTREYGGGILISSPTLAALEDKNLFRYRRLGSIKVRGLEERIDVIEVLEGQEERIIKAKLDSVEDFDQGLGFISKKEFEKSRKCFLRVLEYYPEDRAALRYLELIQEGLNERGSFLLKMDS
jgi:two-component system sensor histidine kinase ChiS